MSERRTARRRTHPRDLSLYVTRGEHDNLRDLVKRLSATMVQLEQDLGTQTKRTDQLQQEVDGLTAIAIAVRHRRP